MSIVMWKHFKEAIVRGMIVSLAGICVIGLVACGSKAKKQNDVSDQATQQEDSRKTEAQENSTEILESSTEDSKSNTSETGKKDSKTKKEQQPGKKQYRDRKRRHCRGRNGR